MSKAATRTKKSAARKATSKTSKNTSARKGASPATKKAAKRTTKKTTKKAAKSAAKKTTKKARRTTKPAAPVLGERPKNLQIDDEVLEFIAAIDSYKLQHGRPFPSWSEILWILKQLGYRKVG